MYKNFSDVRKLFGLRVKEGRKNKNLSQEQFAELIDTGVSTLSKIERGVSFPNPETIEKIITKLNIEPHLLFLDCNDFSIDNAYDEILNKLDILKNDKTKFKIIYDFIMFLSVK